VKCGLAGEMESHCEFPLPTSITCAFHFSRTNRDEWLRLSVLLIREVFFLHLKYKPHERRVLVTMFTEAPSDFSWAIAKGMLCYMSVPSVLFLASSDAILIASSQHSGLIVEVGLKCSTVVSTVRWSCTGFASCSIGSDEFEGFSEDLLDLDGIAHTILVSIRKNSFENRGYVLQNILLVGCIFENKELVDHLLVAAHERYPDLVTPLMKFATINNRLPWSERTWIGSTVFAMTESFAYRSVNRSTFEKFPHIFDSSNLLNEWSSEFEKSDASLISFSPIKQQPRNRANSASARPTYNNT